MERKWSSFDCVAHTQDELDALKRRLTDTTTGHAMTPREWRDFSDGSRAVCQNRGRPLHRAPNITWHRSLSSRLTTRDNDTFPRLEAQQRQSLRAIVDPVVSWSWLICFRVPQPMFHWILFCACGPQFNDCASFIHAMKSMKWVLRTRRPMMRKVAFHFHLWIYDDIICVTSPQNVFLVRS